jgi:hypothetical protein
MKKTLSEGVLTILKEWDSSRILNAAFEAEEESGYETDWSEIIGMILDRIPAASLKKYLKDNEMDEEYFYDTVYEADYDSVISGLEAYLPNKVVEKIVADLAPYRDDEDDYEEED